MSCWKGAGILFFSPELHDNLTICTSSRGKYNALQFHFDNSGSREEFQIKVNGMPKIDESFNPAVIQSKTNCLSVNNRRLKRDQSMILQDGDVIKRTEKKTWTFYDYRASLPDTHDKALSHRFFLERNLTLDRSDELSQVYLAWDVLTFEKFAIKSTSRAFLAKNLADGGINEVTSMLKLSHPNLIKLLEVIEDDDQSFLRMELMDGDLFKILGDSRVLEEDECKFVMHQISSGLQYIHEQGLVHLDIKFDNIFWKKKDGETIYKLGDFEFCTVGSHVRSFVGTGGYFSPELYALGKGECSSIAGFQSDMWSLGATLYAAQTGNLLFGDDDPPEEPDFLEDKWIYFPQLKDLLQKLLAMDPKKRLSSSEILLHPWFDDEKLRARIKRTENVFGLKKVPEALDKPRIHKTESKPCRRSARFSVAAIGNRKSMRIQEAESKKTPTPRRKSIYYETKVQKPIRRKTLF